MKTKSLIALMFLSFTAASAQKLFRSYYDYQKAHIKEEYFANDYGVKNGLYKQYSEYGGILIQGTFKNDKKEGEWDVKDANGHLVSKEVYNNDILNGPASYYNFDVFGAVTISSGTFKDGVREGKWNFIDQFKGSEYNWYYKGIQYAAGWDETGCTGIKYSMTYLGGTEIRMDGKTIFTFYPSGKIYGEQTNAHDSIITKYIYYPNGKLYELFVADSTGRMIVDRTWFYPDGGSKDSISFYIAIGKEQTKKFLERDIKIKQVYSKLKIDTSLVGHVEHDYANISGNFDEEYRSNCNIIFNKAMIYRDTLVGQALLCVAQECLDKIANSINQLYKTLKMIRNDRAGFMVRDYTFKLKSITVADKIKAILE